MTDAKNAGRIDVWPGRADASAADTSESKVFGRLTVWPSYAAAKAHTHTGAADALLLEDGFFLLLEDGSKLLLE